MQINALVDLYNFVSVKYALALGAHDFSRVAGRVSFQLTTGNETFYPLGSDAPVPILPGECVYMDAREILCRLEVKQCEKTKITTETRSTDAVTSWAFPGRKEMPGIFHNGIT